MNSRLMRALLLLLLGHILVELFLAHSPPVLVERSSPLASFSCSWSSVSIGFFSFDLALRIFT